MQFFHRFQNERKAAGYEKSVKNKHTAYYEENDLHTADSGGMLMG